MLRKLRKTAPFPRTFVSHSTNDPYLILGLSRSADSADIRRAYFQAAKRCHPDLFTNAQDTTTAARDFRNITRAYETLRDPRQRAAFDTHGVVGDHFEGSGPAGQSVEVHNPAYITDIV
jgi:molecular chaperone DnaJ